MPKIPNSQASRLSQTDLSENWLKMARTRMDEDVFYENYDCPILGGVALVKIVRRSFTPPDEMDEPIYGPVTFGGCENKWDCGVVAKRLRSGGATFDWPKCAAHQTMNSRGRA